MSDRDNGKCPDCGSTEHLRDWECPQNNYMEDWRRFQWYEELYGPQIKRQEDKESLEELRRIINSLSPEELREFEEILRREGKLDDIIDDADDISEDMPDELPEKMSSEEFQKRLDEIKWKSDVFSDNIFRRMRAQNSADAFLKKIKQAERKAKLSVMSPEERSQFYSQEKEKSRRETTNILKLCLVVAVVGIFTESDIDGKVAGILMSLALLIIIFVRSLR